MVDSTPLLDQPDKANAESPTSFKAKDGVSVDQAFEQWMGNKLGWIQLFQVVILSCTMALDAQQVFISIFTDAAPTWHCKDSGDISCNSRTNVCEISKGSWAWDSPSQVSIVSEWNLECRSSLLTGLPASSLFIGCLVGGIVLGSLADSSLGRKKMLVISCLVMSVGDVMAAFSTDVFMYTAFRFVCGFGRAPVTTYALVMATEMVGKQRRGHVGLLAFSLFTVGFLSLPVMAYLCRSCSWRILYLLISVPPFLYALSAHFFVFESPRWLLLVGRHDEARMILAKLLPADLVTAEWLSSVSYHVRIKEDTPKKNTPSAMKLLVSRTWAFQRLLAVMTTGFGIGMIYFGTSLGVGKLGFNLYLSVAMNALLELPACVMSYFLLNHIGRKSAILVLTVVCGVCSLGCAIVPRDMEGLKILLEITSFFNACTAFDVFVIYMVELFPTCVRNTAMAMARQALTLGGAISPVVIAAFGQGDSQLQYVVFGLGIAFCGLFVIWLPETSGESMSDTMEEEEYRQKIRKSGCLNVA
ncbi:hypothetical protein Dimus_011001 [Dionaea muscipula]